MHRRILLAAVLCLLGFAAVAGERVLLLNAYHPQFRWTAALTRGVQDRLEGRIAGEALYIEYLDGRRLGEVESHKQLLVELLRGKYATLQPDVIISSDDYALHFLLEYGDELFPGVPVVFSGVNLFEHAWLDGKPNFTGLLEGMEISGNLDLILRLRPQTRRIILLADHASLGSLMAREAAAELARQRAAGWHPDVEIEIRDDYRFEELLREAPAWGADTAVLLLAIHVDSGGRYFSYGADVPRLAAAAPGPIFGMWGGMLLGNGVVGGLMNDPYQHGQAAAERALQILDGAQPSELPVIEKAQYRPFFDYRQLRRFAIPESRLPPDSTVEYRPRSFLRTHRSALAVIASLVVVIVVLAINVQRRRRAERALQLLNQQLEQRVAARTREVEQRAQELARLHRIMHGLAFTDSLTDLPNRRAGNDLLQSGVAALGEAFGGVALVLLDIDHFKQINDSHGHDVGDRVLVEVAARLRASLRPQDSVFRWGGEEFLLVLPVASLDDAVAIGERLRLAVAEPLEAPLPAITASLGIAGARGDEQADELLRRADRALYRAKDNGRNRVELAGDED